MGRSSRILEIIDCLIVELHCISFMLQNFWIYLIINSWIFFSDWAACVRVHNQPTEQHVRGGGDVEQSDVLWELFCMPHSIPVLPLCGDILQQGGFATRGTYIPSDDSSFLSAIKKPLSYYQTSNISHTLGDKIVDHSDVASPVGTTPIHSWFNTWLQWIGQRQLQDETRNI